MYSSAMMMPEKAGGSEPATTSILRLVGSMCTSKPMMRITAGIRIIFIMEPRITWKLMENLMAERVIPAENTAIEALALAMRLKEGLAQSGQGIPATTQITARIGAQATGCSSAWSTGSQALPFLAEPGCCFSSEAFISDRPTGMPMALTTMPTMATTSATDGFVPKIGSSTAKPRKPIVGEPLMRALMAASAPVFFLKQYLKNFWKKKTTWPYWNRFLMKTIHWAKKK